MADGAARVLIIEDKELVARSFAMMLRKHGTAVAPSIEALPAVLPTVAPCSVVLSDLGLGDGGASEVLELLETERPDLLPRLFWLTGGGPNVDRYADTIERSGRPVVMKPVGPVELREMVAGALADEG